MQKNSLVAAIVAAMLLVTPAMADQKGNNSNGQGNAQSSKDKCPPGLVKKGNGCEPPGQAKKSAPATPADTDTVVTIDRNFIRGDRLPDDYVTLLDPRDTPFGRNSLFVRAGDYLYLLDRGTGTILRPLGPVRDWDWAWQDTDFQNCPPGLAKKNPPCVPPGLAKDAVLAPDPYPIGAHLPDGYRVVIDPAQYDPNDDIIYTRRGDTIYRINRLNDQVIDLIGNIADLLK